MSECWKARKNEWTVRSNQWAKNQQGEPMTLPEILGEEEKSVEEEFGHIPFTKSGHGSPMIGPSSRPGRLKDG